LNSLKEDFETYTPYQKQQTQPLNKNTLNAVKDGNQMTQSREFMQ
jgi:hypothetical protein